VTTFQQFQTNVLNVLPHPTMRFTDESTQYRATVTYPDTQHTCTVILTRASGIYSITERYPNTTYHGSATDLRRAYQNLQPQ
jgi:hypothetical protein